MDFDKIKTDASGRWLSIWRSLGFDVNETGKHGPCPHCKGKDRFRVDKDVSERGSYFCSGCGPGDGFSLIMKTMSIDIKEAMQEVADIVGSCEKNPIPKEEPANPLLLRKIFMSSSPIIKGDVAYKYLTKRGITKIPQTIRYTRKCWNSETMKDEHTLLAVFSMPCGKAVTMQRIWLTKEGEKLPVKTPKKHLPIIVKSMNSGAVRLWPLEGEVLGVAEGIETALAASEDANIPVWSTLSTALMASFVPPKEVKKLVIFADNDNHFAGHKAAYALAHRMVVEKNIDVDVLVPNVTGWDWLDVLNSKR